ncbi:DUF5713 family protein [Acinetobacter puyangensis]|uniref:DUF5713 family protein n=1 Tax=Acinetobacter puyangensis TaxID=1096779 RepID=UPI003A4DB497
MNDDLLLPMYEDDYYADDLVEKIKTVLIDFSLHVQKTTKPEDIYSFANEAVQKINRLKPLFEERECAIDDIAADYIAEAMLMIVQDSGYFDFDIQELMAYKEF